MCAWHQLTRGRISGGARYAAEQKSIFKPPEIRHLSRTRTALFYGLAVVWASEMIFLGFRTFSRTWADMWQVAVPADPTLAAALSIVWAFAAPAKGAFFVMALFGIRSKNSSTRTALYAMALVPPLNVLFPFRQQGFLLRPTTIGTVLSLVLWGSFFLLREPGEQAQPRWQRDSAAVRLSTCERFRYGWFGLNALVLTAIAVMGLFMPAMALKLLVPCVSLQSEVPSLTHTMLAASTHVLALSVAAWLATFSLRSDPALGRAMAIAMSVHAALMFAFPLRQIVGAMGAGCASSLVSLVFGPLLIGWIVYGVTAGSRQS